MAAEAVVGFVIESFAKLVTEEVKFLAGLREEVEELQLELEGLRSFLRDAQAKKNEKRDIQVWIAQARDLAYEAEDWLEEYAFRISSQRKNHFQRMRFCFLNECFVRHSIGSNIQKLKTRISNTTKRFQDYGMIPLLNGKEDSSSSFHQQLFRRAYSHVANDDFINLDNDVLMLMGHLVNENDGDLQKIVSISGMGGLGKTTLARKVYNHPRIQGYFDNLAWVSISQHWEKSDILQRILIKFFDEKREEILKWEDEKLMREVFQTFGNKKCLVVLDDIWSIEVWESIKDAFPLRKKGSKILLTTRNKNVASHMAPNGLHHEPRLLNDMESWELLQIKALGEEPQIDDEKMRQMKQLGEEMAKYCGGLPLAVVALGGILARNRDIEGWKKVHKNVKAHIGRGEDNMGEQEKVMKILALSYDDLPLKFKPCFLYLGRYPEDSEIDAEILYQLWIAEGIISAKDQIGDESMMDVAERYLRELKERSLVQVVVDEDRMRMTRLKTCRLHDLVRDMNLEKAREENFFSLMHSPDGFDDEVCKLSSLNVKIHRLFIHFKESDDFFKYVPPLKRATRHLRSLRLVYLHQKGYLTPTIFSQISRFQMLRSLEIVGEMNVTNTFNQCSSLATDFLKFPKGISCLLHLRYLSLQGSLFLHLPLSFGNLKQLQTLDLRDHLYLYIPNILRKMTQLRHLHLPWLYTNFAGDKLRFDGLNKLEILENFDSSSCCFGDLVKLTNLRWLKATLDFKDENSVQGLILLLDSKSSIKIHLDIFGTHDDRVGTTGERSTFFKKLFSCENVLKLEVDIPIGNLPKHGTSLASKLVDLTLKNSKLEDDSMETLGKLLNLKYLSLCRKSFMGTQMNCNSGTFLQLRILTLWGLPNLKELIIVKGAMPILLILEIDGCKELQMIPEGLQFIETLQELKVSGMHENFVRRIQVIDGQEGEDYYKIKHVPSISIKEPWPPRREA